MRVSRLHDRHARENDPARFAEALCLDFRPRSSSAKESSSPVPHTKKRRRVLLTRERELWRLKRLREELRGMPLNKSQKTTWRRPMWLPENRTGIRKVLERRRGKQSMPHYNDGSVPRIDDTVPSLTDSKFANFVKSLDYPLGWNCF